MPEDYYADSNPGPEGEKPEPAEPREEASDSQTAEIPKSVLGGKEFKPGEEVVLEVVQVNENSVVVRYATGEEESEEAPAPTGEPEAGGNPGGGMSSMYE